MTSHRDRTSQSEHEAGRSWGATGLVIRAVLWGLIVAGAISPILVARFLPSLDYYHWVFEAYLVSEVLSGTSLPDFYDVQLAPVPNLASSFFMGVLGLLLDPQQAGRVFVALAVLFFAGTFGFLTRTLQRRPTAIEFLGLPWAFGYFLYMGYLSYLAAVGLAMLGIGILLRVTRADRVPGVGVLAGLALLSITLYLAHLAGWLVYAVMLVAISAFAFGDRRARYALEILATLVPTLLLLGWYLLRSSNPSDTRIYDSLADKADSLINPLMVVLRIDPFPPLMPVFWVNLGFFLLVAAMLWINRDARPLDQGQRLILTTSLVLLAGAVLLPFSWFAGLLRPDERLLFPAVLLLLAAFPAPSFSIGRSALVVGGVLALMLFHMVEYRESSENLARVDSASHEIIPAREPVLSLSVHTGDLTQNACTVEPWGHSMGIPVLQHFPMNRLTGPETGRAHLFGTGIVRVRGNDEPEPPDLVVQVVTPEQALEGPDLLQARASGYVFVQVTGCEEHVALVADALSPDYAPVAEGPGYVILERDIES